MDRQVVVVAGCQILYVLYRRYPPLTAPCASPPFLSCSYSYPRKAQFRFNSIRFDSTQQCYNTPPLLSHFLSRGLWHGSSFDGADKK